MLGAARLRGVTAASATSPDQDQLVLDIGAAPLTQTRTSWSVSEPTPGAHQHCPDFVA